MIQMGSMKLFVAQLRVVACRDLGEVDRGLEDFNRGIALNPLAARVY
jgi:hypothetical protein